MGPAKNKTPAGEGPSRGNSQSSESLSVQTASDIKLIKQICSLLNSCCETVKMYNDMNNIHAQMIGKGNNEAARYIKRYMRNSAEALEHVAEALESDWFILADKPIFNDCGNMESFAQMVNGVQLLPGLAKNIRDHARWVGETIPPQFFQQPAFEPPLPSEVISGKNDELIKCENRFMNGRHVSWHTCVKDCEEYYGVKAED